MADPRYGYPGAMPFYSNPYAGMAYPFSYPQGTPSEGTNAFVGATPYAPQMSGEQELDFLRNQAQNIKSQLEQIDARIKELEAEE